MFVCRFGRLLGGLLIEFFKGFLFRRARERVSSEAWAVRELNFARSARGDCRRVEKFVSRNKPRGNKMNCKSVLNVFIFRLFCLFSFIYTYMNGVIKRF